MRTRRSFLASAGTAGAAAALAGAPAQAAGPRANTTTVPFHGEHQAGIATPTSEHIQFATLDFATDAASDLRAVMLELSGAAARLMAGRPVGALETGIQPPVDTGEAVGLGPGRLTVTFGLGPAVFRRGRFGLEHLRPAPLVALPSFETDALDPRLCGGDLAIQVCGEDPQVVFHAVHNLIRLAGPAAVPRWSLAGFGPTRNSRGIATPRNLLGFKEGTANIVAEDPRALERFVWAGAPESLPWMHGGSYMVVRRIKLLLGAWDQIGLDQQERTFGRHKLSGAPLGAEQEFAPLDLERRAIPGDAHVRLASPDYNHGQRLLRRGYSYTDGIDHAEGSASGGQLFICFNRDPRRQFIPIQRRLAAGDALGAVTEHVGSAVFACPPGPPTGGYVGRTLLG
ncbi:MAG TPA: Dyp-type peroxidase [Solirubrobacteraceae bacterium]|nr:Dyp-type peroxidase [Solirubrobacteraceae bacterium]